MKRKYLFVSVVVLTLFAYGCNIAGSDSASGVPETPPGDSDPVVRVLPAEIVTIDTTQIAAASYSGTLPSTKTDVLDLIGSGFLEQVLTVIGDYLDYVDAFKEQNGGGLPTGVSNWIDTENTEGTEGALTISISNASFSTATAPALDINENLHGYNGETGGITVPSLTGSLTYSESESSAITMNASLISRTNISDLRYDVNGVSNYDSELGKWIYEAGYADHTIKAGRINANLNGSLVLDNSSPNGTATYNIAVSLSGGAVLSPAPGVDTPFGGKFIFDLSFRSKSSLTFVEDELGDISLTGTRPDFSLEVKAYDNSNQLQETYSFTLDDLVSMASSPELEAPIQESLMLLAR